MDEQRFQYIENRISNLNLTNEFVRYIRELIDTVKAAKVVGKIWQKRETELVKQIEKANDQIWNLERIIDVYRKGYKELKEDFAETRIRLEAKNKLLIAEVEEHNCACGDALDSLWKEILINHPDYGDWTYPGEAYRHIKAEFDDLRKQLAASQAENTAIEEFIAEHGTIGRTYARENR